MVMDPEIVEQLFLSLKEASSKEGTRLHIEGHGKKAISFDNVSFIPIIPDSEATLSYPIVFVDGGNLEIFSSPHFSVQVIRLCAVKYQGTKRETRAIREFFCLIKTVVKEDMLTIEVESFGNSPIGKLSFKAYDPELTEGR